METLFTGIKPTGNMHLGNYVGAIHNALNVSKNRRSYFCVVDLHAITVEWSPEELNKLSQEITLLYLAAGFDLGNCSFFIQSHNFDHPYLGWLLNCLAPMGLMGHMTQYKEKSEGKKESVSVGLFDYPVLMAADILLYDADVVPVGEDQVQHVELARDLAKKFNNLLGDTFKIPRAVLNDKGFRIRSLQHPEKKMSKSEKDTAGCIYLLDKPEDAVKKIMRAVTDSESEIGYDWENREAVSNLIDIYSIFSNESIENIVVKYRGKGYGQFKKDLGEIIFQFLTSYQKKYYELKDDPQYIKSILDKGLEESRAVTSKKVDEVRRKIGFIV